MGLGKTYVGDYGAVNVYCNGQKLAGYHEQTAQGTDLTIPDTYNDIVDVTALGKTDLVGDWVQTQGGMTQGGTPSPENPVPIVPAVAAGTYQTEIDGQIYELTLSKNLYGDEQNKDLVEIDRVRKVGRLVKKLSADIANNTTSNVFDNISQYILSSPVITSLALTQVSSSSAPVLPATEITLIEPSTKYPFGEKSVEGVTVTCASGVPSARPATTATTTDTLRGMPVTSDYSHPTYTDNAGQAWVADTIERKGGIVTKTVRIDPIDLTVPLSAQMDKIKANPVVTDITSAEDGQALLGLKSYPHQTTISASSEVVVGVKQMD